MRVHIYPLTCDICGGGGMGTSSANAAAWNLHARVVHSNPDVCRAVLEQMRRELESSAAPSEGEDKAGRPPSGGMAAGTTSRGESA